MKNDWLCWVWWFKNVQKDKFIEFWMWQLIKEQLLLIKLWWYRLWIRKNEFHRSLDYEKKGLSKISINKREQYEFDLRRRREIIHNKDISEIDEVCGVKFDL